jgi:hypothetical protein
MIFACGMFSGDWQESWRPESLRHQRRFMSSAVQTVAIRQIALQNAWSGAPVGVLTGSYANNSGIIVGMCCLNIQHRRRGLDRWIQAEQRQVSYSRGSSERPASKVLRASLGFSFLETTQAVRSQCKRIFSAPGDMRVGTRLAWVNEAVVRRGNAVSNRQKTAPATGNRR